MSIGQEIQIFQWSQNHLIMGHWNTHLLQSDPTVHSPFSWPITQHHKIKLKFTPRSNQNSYHSNPTIHHIQWISWVGHRRLCWLLFQSSRLDSTICVGLENLSVQLQLTKTDFSRKPKCDKNRNFHPFQTKTLAFAESISRSLISDHELSRSGTWRFRSCPLQLGFLHFSPTRASGTESRLEPESGARWVGAQRWILPTKSERFWARVKESENWVWGRGRGIWELRRRRKKSLDCCMMMGLGLRVWLIISMWQGSWSGPTEGRRAGSAPSNAAGRSGVLLFFFSCLVIELVVRIVCCWMGVVWMFVVGLLNLLIYVGSNALV